MAHLKYFLVILFSTVVLYAKGQVRNIVDFGAVGDGKTINTKAIQKAIDQSAAEGTQLLIPEGIFLSGTLHLKTGTSMILQKNAVLKGSPSFNDYPDHQVRYQNAFTHENGVSRANKAFIFAEEVENISISGEGTIDGSGDSGEFQLGNDDNPKSRLRPCLLLIVNSKNITLRGLKLRNPAYWMQNYLGCDGLKLIGLDIYAHSNYNQDGIDIDAKNVLVEKCKIDVDDDGICFKSHDVNRPVENVVVRNCLVATNCNAIKFGTMSIGGLRKVKISGITIQKASSDHIRQWQKNLKFIGLPTTVISGIALESVDGAIIEDIDISNITMRDVQTPIFIVLGNRGRGQAAGKGFYEVSTENPTKIGRISSVKISNIKASSYSKMSSSITAYPGQYVENVTLNNISFEDMGGGTVEDSKIVLKENSKAYPENRMYGLVYPASGLFLRHVKGIRLINTSFKVRNEEYRSSIVCDDVVNAKIFAVSLQAPKGVRAPIALANCKNITVERPIFKMDKRTLIGFKGMSAKEVRVIGFAEFANWIVEERLD